MHGNIALIAWGVLWVALILGFNLMRNRERMRLYDVIEKAMQSGAAIPPELWARLGRRGWRPFSDLRAGVVWLAVGIGLAIGGVINFYTYTGPHPMLFFGPYGMFPIPIAVGVGFLVMAYIRRGAP